MKKSNKKNKPKTHRVKIGTRVRFKHAGRFRTGQVTELTFDPDGHATYTVVTSADNKIYPRLGVDGSKWMGWIQTTKFSCSSDE